MIKNLMICAVLLGMAVPASAQRFSLSFGKQDRKRSHRVEVNFGKGLDVRLANRDYRARGREGRYDRGRGKHRQSRAKLRHRRGHNGHRGHYRVITERVWIPPCARRIYVPARYGYRYDSCMRRVRYCIAAACYKTVYDPGRWEFRTRRVHY